MKTQVESLLENDHEALDLLPAELEVELSTHNSDRAFKLLDLFWARLAVHIRAENLHLFPALANAPPALFTKERGLPSFASAQEILLSLRSDHEFFMKELALMIKGMREMSANQVASLHEIQDMRQRMSIIKDRLETHNQLEEDQVYTWPALLFDEETIATLHDRLRHELENLPPRFA